MAAKKQQTTYTLQDALQQMITNYNNTPTWKARTAAERNQIAQDEYKALYDQYRLNAQQAYDTSDLALQQQRAGIADTYNQQREQSAQNYRQAVSDSDRAMLQRGMQRSTYGLQLANGLRQKGIDAQQAINEAQGKAEMNIDQQRALAARQLAQQFQQYGNSEAAEARKYARQLEEQDYERGLQGAQYQNQLFGQIYNAIAQKEAQDIANEQWNKQFGLSEKQFNTSVDQWNKQFGLNEKQFEYGKERDAVSDEQWQKQFDTSTDQWNKQFEQQVKQWENSNNQWERELAEQIRQFDILHPQAGTATGGGYSGGYSGGGKKSGSGTGTAKTTTQQPVSDKTLFDEIDQPWTLQDGLNNVKNWLVSGSNKSTLSQAERQANIRADKEAKADAAFAARGLNPKKTTTSTATTTSSSKTNTVQELSNALGSWIDKGISIAKSSKSKK